MVLFIEYKVLCLIERLHCCIAIVRFISVLITIGYIGGVRTRRVHELFSICCDGRKVFYLMRRCVVKLCRGLVS
ncbi:hypothetical protein T4E_3842 [Trichinella pseudospiralis]|uniref:Uncharacterized protein n=1 Tax=Trichinella pseudospiralis TaxID=6337 RepID=A0A0V0XXY7_TRIPS|nr:hypothetical protein T4E_3842 [Trichinella pseudospiralis]